VSETQNQSDADYCREQVMRYDPDRFRTVLFAPAAVRDDLSVLYAFNLEIARIRETVSEPLLGAMRLQWWRETLDAAYRGEARRHAVAAPFADLIVRHGLPRAALDRLLDARGRDMEEGGFESLAAMTGYAEDTAGVPVLLAQSILGAVDGPALVDAARHMGAAWALTGLLRALSHRLRQGRETLPRDVTGRHGISGRTLRAFEADDGVRSAVAEVASVAGNRLAAARTAVQDLPSAARSPFLLCPLVDIYLDRLRRAGHAPFAPDIAAPVPFATARMAWRWFRGGV